MEPEEARKIETGIQEIPKPKRKKARNRPLIIQVEHEKDGISYDVFLFNEMHRLKPLMIMFFASIGFDKAKNNPEPYLMRAVQESYNSLTQIYVASKDSVPIGYFWYRVETGIYGGNIGMGEQLYVLDDYRHKVGVIERLMMKFLDFAKRLDTKQLILHAATAEHQKLWASYGFENSYLVMKFDGTVDEFIKRNGIEKLKGRVQNGR